VSVHATNPDAELRVGDNAGLSVTAVLDRAPRPSERHAQGFVLAVKDEAGAATGLRDTASAGDSETNGAAE